MIPPNEGHVGIADNKASALELRRMLKRDHPTRKAHFKKIPVGYPVKYWVWLSPQKSVADKQRSEK